MKPAKTLTYTGQTLWYERELRFAYWVGKTYERAEAVLEDMFANGEVCEGERPVIIRQAATHFVIALPAA